MEPFLIRVVFNLTVRSIIIIYLREFNCKSLRDNYVRLIQIRDQLKKNARQRIKVFFLEIISVERGEGVKTTSRDFGDTRTFWHRRDSGESISWFSLLHRVIFDFLHFEVSIGRVTGDCQEDRGGQRGANRDRRGLVSTGARA